MRMPPPSTTTTTTTTTTPTTLTVIGALSIDTISVPGRKVRNVFGGSAGYASIAGSFFTSVGVVSNIGEDYPQQFIDILTNRGINISGIRKIAGGKSSHFEVEYDDEFTAKYQAINLNVLEERIILPPYVRDSKYVYIATNDPEIQLALIEKLSSTQIVATDTHLYWIKHKRDRVKEVMERVDIMFADDTEVCEFSAKRRLKLAAEQILDLGVSKLIVKKREHGAVLFAEGKMYPTIAYDTYDLEVVDITGYGGTLAGGFLGMLADEPEHEEPLNNILLKALAFGLVVSSFKIMDFSINGLLNITKEDIWRRYDRFRDMLTIRKFYS